MKFIIVAAVALVAVVAALPVEEELVKQVAIIKSEVDQGPEGYKFSFESGDGTQRDEIGSLKETVNEKNEPTKVVVVRGSFTYINPEGNPETISYYADESGFHAEGPSIPVAPVASR